MKLKLIPILMAILLIFLHCQKDSTGPDSNDVSGIQQDIFWPSLADSPWPMFQHDPQGTGRSRFAGPQKGIICQTINLNSGSDPSFLAIDANQNFYFAIGNYWADSTGRTDAYLFSYDIQGNQNWYVNMDGRELYCSPLINKNGIIYIGSTDGIFYAINSNGTLKWTYDAGSPITSGYGGATIGIDGTIYFSTRNALNAINQAGERLWSKNEYGDTPIVFSPDGNILYVKHISEGLDALDQDGNLIWRYPFATGNWMFHPVVDCQNRIYFFADRSTVAAIDGDGEPEWQFSIENHKQRVNDFIDQTTAPTLDSEGNFYFTTTDDFYSLDYAGNLRWIVRGMGSLGSHLICDKNNNIFLSKLLGGEVVSISNTGILKWILTLDSSAMVTCSAVITADSRLILGGYDNSKSKLYIIK